MLKLKQYFIQQSIHNSLRTLVISILLTLFIFWGIKTFRLDDDLVKTFPQDLPSKIIWDDIIDEFGQTEFVFVSFGKLNQKILDDKYAIKQNQLFTDAVLENISGVDKVISLSTYNKFDGDSDYLDIGLLQADNFLTEFENDEVIDTILNDIKVYFDKNPDQKQRLVSTNNDYLNIAIRPIDESNGIQILLRTLKN